LIFDGFLKSYIKNVQYKFYVNPIKVDGDTAVRQSNGRLSRMKPREEKICRRQ